MTITGNGGSVIATGRIKNGKQTPTPGSCRLTWEVTNVKPDQFAYAISFGHRAPAEVSEAELRAGYEASIGNGS